MSWLGKILFRKYQPARRRKEMRFLGLALFLAVLFCLLLGAIIFLLYAQNRI